MADTMAAQRSSRAWMAAALAWSIPGAGHLYLGRRARAAIFLALIAVAILIGWALDGNLYRPVAGEPLTILGTIACMGMGAPYFILRYMFGYSGEVVAPGYEYGSAFLLTAGLMNLLLVLDALDIGRGRKS